MQVANRFGQKQNQPGRVFLGVTQPRVARNLATKSIKAPNVLTNGPARNVPRYLTFLFLFLLCFYPSMYYRTLSNHSAFGNIHRPSIHLYRSVQTDKYISVQALAI